MGTLARNGLMLIFLLSFAIFFPYVEKRVTNASVKKGTMRKYSLIFDELLTFSLTPSTFHLPLWF